MSKFRIGSAKTPRVPGAPVFRLGRLTVRPKLKPVIAVRTASGGGKERRGHLPLLAPSKD